MKFYVPLLIFLAILFQASASDTESLPQENTVKMGAKELDYSKSSFFKEDWEKILFHQDSLEKLDLSYATFWERDYIVSSPKNFGVLFPEALEVHLPMLKELFFDWHWHKGGPNWRSQFDESPLIFISHQTNLEILSLNGWLFGGEDRYGDFFILKDFRLLSSLTKLKSLSLADAYFTPYTIEQMQYTLFPNLEFFNADESNIKGFHWEIFAPNLKALSLAGRVGGAQTLINGTDLTHIAKLSNLEKLNVSFSKIPGGSIKQLAKLPNLTELFLATTDMTKADFSGLKSLQTLDLSDCNFSIASFTSLQQLQNLKKLKLKSIHSWGKNPNISPAMIQELQGKLPNCEIEL